MTRKTKWIDNYDTCIASEYIDAVLLYLGDGQWHKAKEITRAVDITSVQLRRIANQTGLLISSVTCGYMLTNCASREDFEECLDQLECRIKGLKRHIRRLRIYRGKMK